MKEFFSIQEFSQLTGVETSTLRYWDDIGLFSPINRNPTNNYRYYSVEQILALNFVTVLSELDIPLKTIAELRKDREPQNMMRLLDQQEKKMDMELRNLRRRYSIIHARRELIMSGMAIDEEHVSLAEIDRKELILWPRNEYENEDDTFIAPLAAFIGKSHTFNVNLSFPVGGYYDDMDSFANGPLKPQHFISVDPTGQHIIEDGEYLTGYARGYYGLMGDLPERMTRYAEENGLVITGPVYVLYLFEEITTHTPEDYLAQVIVSVSKARQ